MRRAFIVPFLAVGVLVGVTQPAAAQRGDWTRVDLLLRATTNVPQELALSEEQTSHLRDASQQARKSFLARISLNATAEERALIMVEVVKEENRELEQAITQILKPAQLKRLRQIYFQDRGGWAFESSEVREALRLAPEQLEKIKAVNAKAEKAIGEVAMAEPRPTRNTDEYREKMAEVQKKRTDLRNQARDTVLDLLSDQQKKAWMEFIGAPFEVKRTLREGSPAS